jgi:hypothetical protein
MSLIYGAEKNSRKRDKEKKFLFLAFADILFLLPKRMSRRTLNRCKRTDFSKAILV